MPTSSPPELFDAHLHPSSLSTQDLESMRYFGVERALVFAAISEAKPKAVLAAIQALLTEELPRLTRAGIHAVAAVGIHPRCVPRRGLQEVLAALPEAFGNSRVVAIGEIGLQTGSEEEEEAFAEQLLLAKRLKVPVVVHTPSAEKERLTRRMLVRLRESNLQPLRILVDHANARTAPLILGCGHYAGMTLHPDELKTERAVAFVRRWGSERLVFNSDAGARPGDILSLARAASLLEKAKLGGRLLQRVAHDNALDFLGLPAR